MAGTNADNTSATVRNTALDCLRRWAEYSERYWFEIPSQPELGFFGTGFPNWGVQTNQKYIGAMAVPGRDGRSYILVANFADRPVKCRIPQLGPGRIDLATGARTQGSNIDLEPLSARLFAE